MELRKFGRAQNANNTLQRTGALTPKMTLPRLLCDDDVGCIGVSTNELNLMEFVNCCCVKLYYEFEST